MLLIQIVRAVEAVSWPEDGRVLVQIEQMLTSFGLSGPLRNDAEIEVWTNSLQYLHELRGIRTGRRIVQDV